MKLNYSVFLTDTVAREKLMAVRSAATVAFFLVFVAAAAIAAPPANDNFGNAQLLGGLSGSSLAVSNIQATLETLEPPHARNKGGRSVWFKYVALGTGVVRFTTVGPFDTTVAVYQGTSLGNLVLMGDNDDVFLASGTAINGSVSVGVESGKTYYIAVDSSYNYNNGNIPTGAFTLDYTFVNAVSNDNFASAIPLAVHTSALVTSNVGAGKESGEPNHANNAGGKSVWFKFSVPPAIGDVSYTFQLESKNLAATAPVNTLLAAYTGSSVNALTLVTKSDYNGINKIVFNGIAGTTYYIAIDGADFGTGASTGTFSLRLYPTKNVKRADFENDNRADISVFRPSTGVWFSIDSVTDKLRVAQFGANGDRPLIADMGQDGLMDNTVFRPDTGVWYFNISSSGFHARSWGMAGDIPMFNKFNNQNYTGMAVFRPVTGTWWLHDGFNFKSIQFGQNGDVPVLSDFTGDGADDPAVFRPSNGVWYILTDPATTTYKAIQFGRTGDVPVAADYDGDGLVDIAIYRPSTGTWWILKTSNNQPEARQFGISTDRPQPADYDGDGKDDIAVFRDGVWWILQSNNGAVKAVQFGLPGDIPMAYPLN